MGHLRKRKYRCWTPCFGWWGKIPYEAEALDVFKLMYSNSPTWMTSILNMIESVVVLVPSSRLMGMM